jgi:acyl carrier protein
MDHEHLRAEVEQLIRQQMPTLDCPEITDDTTFEDLGLDSLHRVDLLAAAEIHFDIEVPDGEVANLVRVQDLTSFIASARVG